jgi:hypothetical protein
MYQSRFKQNELDLQLDIFQSQLKQETEQTKAFNKIGAALGDISRTVTAINSNYVAIAEGNDRKESDRKEKNKFFKAFA